jgi:hypothetical protein
MEAYFDSELYAGNLKNGGRGNCDFGKDYCHSLAPVCHYVTPRTMYVLHELTRQRHPSKYRYQDQDQDRHDGGAGPAFKDPQQTPPPPPPPNALLQEAADGLSLEEEQPIIVVDIISVLSSNKRLNHQKVQRESLERHISVRNFVSFSESDVPGRNCSQQLSRQEAKDIVAKCKTREYPKGQTIMASSQKFFGKRDVTDVVGWLCRQALPIASLFQTLKQYEMDKTPLPDYLLLLKDTTYYNMEVLHEELQFRPDRANWTKSSSAAPWGMSGCLRKIDGMPFKYPIVSFGLVFSKGTLQMLTEPLYCKDRHGTENGTGSSVLDEWKQDACDRIQENGIGERDFFRNGMHLLSLFNALATRPTTKDELPNGVCFSDGW